MSRLLYKLYILLTDITHVVYGALNYYYLLHYRGIGVALLILYVTYQIVDSTTGFQFLLLYSYSRCQGLRPQDNQ